MIVCVQWKIYMQVNLTKERCYLIKLGLEMLEDSLDVDVMQGKKDYKYTRDEVRKLIAQMERRLADVPRTLDDGEVF
jgi:hypothetical protein